MGLLFCFIGVCPDFKFILIYVSSIVRFDLITFSKSTIILSFSDWSVVVAVLSNIS